MQDYESQKLFYLGRYENGNEVLYKNKDLTTHALVIGMTGSGKTGLGVGLIEEAALDNIPSIVIDPKGDMGNLLLSFPNLSTEEFLPWIDPEEAANKNQTPEELAQESAQNWENGLKEWNEDKERVARLKESAEFTIYTPAASFGVGVNILSSFNAPSQEVLDDPDTLNTLISSSATSILSLIGINADPLSSKEHILLSSIFLNYYKNSKDVSLESLITLIVTPPFDKVGVFSLETFFPKDKRLEFAMKLNAIVASPSFSAWLEGENMDIKKFLYTKEGKARVAVFSIAHLSDNERMFFVTLLLNNLIAWIRGGEGTLNLRAILYMDEIFGYFPPNANPPSKLPMLTLLKQARAFGLGVVLSTQNPVDLDYKGLSNIGTWFIGRLQTAQDKERVIDGLSGIKGSDFNKQELLSLISNLKKRHFLLKNINEEGLSVFQTRWTLVYLKGPLSKEQIRRLTKKPLREAVTQTVESVSASSVEIPPQKATPKAANFISTLKQYYFYDAARENYRLSPYLVCEAKVRYVSTRKGLDKEEILWCETPIEKEAEIKWSVREALNVLKLESAVRSGSDFDEIASFVDDSKKLGTLQKDAVEAVSRSAKLTLYSVPALKLESGADESLESFNTRVKDKLDEIYISKAEDLKQKSDKIQKGLEDKYSTLSRKLETEKAQARSKTLDTVVSFGGSILGAILGGGKATTISKTTSGVKNANKMLKERSDVKRVEDEIAAVTRASRDEETKYQNDIKALKEECSFEKIKLEEVAISPRKTDIYDEKLFILWREV